MLTDDVTAETDDEQKSHKLAQKLMNRPRTVHLHLNQLYLMLHTAYGLDDTVTQVISAAAAAVIDDVSQRVDRYNLITDTAYRAPYNPAVSVSHLSLTALCALGGRTGLQILGGGTNF